MSIRDWFKNNVFGGKAVDQDMPCPQPAVVHGQCASGATVCGDESDTAIFDREVTCSKCRKVMTYITRHLSPINPVTDPVVPVRKPRVYTQLDDSSDLIVPNPVMLPLYFPEHRPSDTPPPAPIVVPPSVPDASPSSSSDTGAGDYNDSSGSGGDYGSTDCGSSSHDSGGGW